MEQTPSLPGRSPELPSVSLPSNSETLGTRQSPEIAGEGLIERQESRGETASSDSQMQDASGPALVGAVQQPLPAVDGTTQITVSSPSVANDDDLIEKEWVDRAKKVLAETKDDPYRREQEVNRLQADYLMKRYGRQLGLRSEH